MAGHTAAITCEAKMFLCGGLYIDLAYFHIQYSCNIFPHGRNMILQLRALGDHGNINISHFIPGFCHLLPNDPQQF